ncbi:hypothetical protein ACLMJK_005065 [Lecanora helva]
MSQCPHFAAAFTFNGPRDRTNLPSLEKTRKRKRSSATSISDAAGPISDLDSTTLSPTQLTSSKDSREENLTEDVKAQFAVSGQPANGSSPGGNFPHTSRPDLEDHLTSRSKSAVADELGTLHPPLYPLMRTNITGDGGNSIASGQRQQHLAVITAVMHKCLLQGDYGRASRAWGLMLRAEHGGHSLDLRTNDRWGLGAELLLHQQPSFKSSVAGTDHWSSLIESSDQHIAEGAGYKIEHVEQAKDYYERLVLQYPYRKTSPNSTNAQDFYLAMFGLWIYSVKERQQSLEASRGQDSSRETEIGLEDDSDLISPNLPMRQHRLLRESRQNTLQHANEIAGRLKELLNSPPYSDNPQFWELLGMVSLWIGDLSLQATSKEGRTNSDDEDSSAATENVDSSNSLDIEEISQSKLDDGLTGRDRALSDAGKAFENAKRFKKRFDIKSAGP